MANKLFASSSISLNLFVKHFVRSGLYTYANIFVLNLNVQTKVHFEQNLHSLKPSFQFPHTTIPHTGPPIKLGMTQCTTRRVDNSSYDKQH